MRGRSSFDAAALAAGVLTCGMAIYHFFLPSAFHWDEDLSKAPMLRWGVGTINACFSFLLLAGGAMTVGIAFGREPRDRTGTWVLFGMSGFWLFNAAYQVLAPMPLPPRLAGLRWGFLGFAVGAFLLYCIALRRSRPLPASRSA